jgi:hypothetical protein|nr:MAG TPA: hypothetical protein [Caudoviricetes sp.]
MAEIYSNSFTSQVNRATTSTAIYSNTFTTTINKAVVQETSKNTQINIYNGSTLLTAVNETPTTGQYKVTITDTINCTAKLESDFKTVTLLTVTGNAGEIHITINIEGKTTVNKTIPVAAITKSSVIKATETQYEQLSDRFSWWVKGTSTASMQLTQDALNIITKQVKVTGDMMVDGAIDGKTIIGATILNSATNPSFSVDPQGKVNSSNINVTGGNINVNDNFRVRDDGTCEAKDLLIEGRISCKELIAESSNVKWQDKSLVRNCKVYVTYGYTYPDDFDEDNFEDGMTFASFSDLQDVVPRNLNGYTLDIYVTKKHTENIYLNNFNNGRVRVAMQGHQLNGSIAFYGHGMDYEFYGDVPGSVNNSSVYCNIVPGANGRLQSSYRYCLVADRCRVTVYDVRCYSGTATDYKNNGICCTNGAIAYLSSISAINSPNALVRCHSASHVYIASSSGRTSAETFHCVSGSIIQLNKGTHCGTTSSKGAKYISNNGQIFDTGVTYNSVVKDDTSTPTPDVPKLTSVTKTIKSSGGRSWRTSGNYANSWSSESVVRQGTWTSGNGKNVGYWFFDSDIYNILQNPDYTVTGIKVKVTRQSGGRNASVTHYLRAHTYAKRPSGTPSQLGTGVINKKFSLATGSSITLTLSSSEITSLISNKAKGLGICTSDYTTGAGGSYSCCSASCSVTITYTTTE